MNKQIFTFYLLLPNHSDNSDYIWIIIYKCKMQILTSVFLDILDFFPHTYGNETAGFCEMSNCELGLIRWEITGSFYHLQMSTENPNKYFH